MRVVNLLLHFRNWIGVTHPLNRAFLRIVEDERRFGIEVARLPDASDIDDVAPAFFESQLAAVLHVAMSHAAVRLLHPILGDMRVADKHKRSIGERKGFGRSALV